MLLCGQLSVEHDISSVCPTSHRQDAKTAGCRWIQDSAVISNRPSVVENLPTAAHSAKFKLWVTQDHTNPQEHKRHEGHNNEEHI